MHLQLMLLSMVEVWNVALNSNNIPFFHHILTFFNSYWIDFNNCKITNFIFIHTKHNSNAKLPSEIYRNTRSTGQLGLNLGEILVFKLKFLKFWLRFLLGNNLSILICVLLILITSKSKFVDIYRSRYTVTVLCSWKVFYTYCISL